MNVKTKNSLFGMNFLFYAKKGLLVFVVLMTLLFVSGCNKIKVTEITLDKKDLVLEIGEEITVTGTVLPTDATDKELTWVSSKPEVAKVVAGKVTALTVGEAVISAKISKIEASFKVTVIEAKVEITFANTTLEKLILTKGEKLSVPVIPLKEGHTFENWYSDSAFTTLYNFENKVEENLTIYAKFAVDEFTITFANTDLENQKVKPNERMLLPREPFKEGYDFIGWTYADETPVDFDAVLTKDLTIYANFSLKNHKVIFGNTDLADDEVVHGDKVSIPSEPIKEGFIFEGWYIDEVFSSLYNFDSKVINPLTIYAKFTEILDFVIVLENSGWSHNLMVSKGETFIIDDVPVKEGFVFVGWFIDEEMNTLYNFDLPVMKDLTLYAKFEEIKYTVTLISYGNVILDEISVVKGENLSSIEDYERDGFIFVDWYSNVELTVKAKLSQAVLEDMTLYAKWTARTDVVYTVNHYLYSTSAGEFLIDTTDSFVGTTGEEVIAPIKTYPGLMSEYAIYSGIIKGDGSLVINIRYIEFNGDINYHLNGGNFTYENREAMSLDFLKDYNQNFGTSITLIDLEGYGNWSPINMHVLLFKEPYRTKWMWMIDYLGQVGSTTNKSACKTLKTAATVEAFNSGENNKYAVEYEVRAFILGIKYTKNASWMSSDYSDYQLGNGFWNLFSSSNEVTKFTTDGSDVSLINKVYKEGFVFKGWYFDKEFTMRAVASVNRGCDLYAKWDADNPLTEIRIVNQVSEMIKLSTHQLQLDFLPANAFSKEVKYLSTDETILHVSESGLITALNTGKATIFITSQSGDVSIGMTITIPVVSNIVVDVSNNYNGVLEVGKELNLDITSFGIYQGKELEFSSSNLDILTVSSLGIVTAISEGEAIISISVKEFNSVFMSLAVNVKNLANDTAIDKLLKLLVDSHQPVVDKINASLYFDDFSSYQQYYDAVYGSVNLFLFDDLNLDRETYAVTPNVGFNTSGPRASTEFIAVHDTANLSGGLAGHGSYWLTATTSIHFTVGDFGVIGNLPENLVAYHAGDGTSATFSWTDTTVLSNGSAPIIDISGDGYFTFNGSKSSVKAPTGSSGQILDKSYFSTLGPAWKIGENNNYFIGTTYFTTSQVSRGVIASRGGNNNSVGIEMCVNTTGEIYDTWQRNAKLVAMLLKTYNLDLTRVQQHNSFSGKNCPQSLRMSNYWDKFMAMVALELEIQTNYSDAIISIESHNLDLISKTGRIIGMPVLDTAASYTLTVKLGDETRSIKLGVIVPGTASWKQLNGYFSTK